MAGDPRALGANGPLAHLDHELLAFFDHLANRRLAGDAAGVAAAFLGGLLLGLFHFLGRQQVFDVQEGGAVEPDIDEGGLHAGQHSGDSPEVNASDRRAILAPFEIELTQDAVLDQADPRLTDVYVDE